MGSDGQPVTPWVFCDNCDRGKDHEGECMWYDDVPDTQPVTMGGKVIGEATYIGDGMVSISVDDKFAKRFMTDSINNLSIATPNDKDK